MNRSFATLALCLVIASHAARADITIGQTAITFATAEEGKKLLSQRDAFIQALSPFDRSAILKADKDVTEKEFLDFIEQNVTDWPADEKAKVQAALEALQPRLQALALPYPKTIPLIHTTGLEEGGAAYTRGTAIILPTTELGQSPAALQGLIAHESFHVLSRANPALRDKAYAAIGFEKCDEVQLPPDLNARHITNPDAPFNNHCIQLKVADQNVWAIPILLASPAKYDPARGDEFFQYMTFKWLLVDRGPMGQVAPSLKEGAPQLLNMAEVAGFYEQVGRNTTYTIHPEEILADNFKLLVTTGTVRSPDVLAKFKSALASPATTRTAPADH